MKYQHSPRSLRNLNYLREKIGLTERRGPKNLKCPIQNSRSLRYLKRKRDTRKKKSLKMYHKRKK